MIAWKPLGVRLQWSFFFLRGEFCSSRKYLSLCGEWMTYLTVWCLSMCTPNPVKVCWRAGPPKSPKNMYSHLAVLYLPTQTVLVSSAEVFTYLLQRLLLPPNLNERKWNLYFAAQKSKRWQLRSTLMAEGWPTMDRNLPGWHPAGTPSLPSHFLFSLSLHCCCPINAQIAQKDDNWGTQQQLLFPETISW